MQIGSIVQYTPDGDKPGHVHTTQPGVVLKVVTPTTAEIIVIGPLLAGENVINVATVAANLTKANTCVVISPF